MKDCWGNWVGNWNSLDQRRKFARLKLFYKMAHRHIKTVPDYLKRLVPDQVGAGLGYELRNVHDLRTIKTKKVKVYNSYIPKSVREWNNLDLSKYAPTLSSFEASYKKGMLRSPNKLNQIELGNANIYHTRLRLGLSHQKSHLFTYNLISSPLCGWGLENETTDHYILRCPAFGAARIEMYKTMVETLDDHLYVLKKRQ